MTVFDISDGLKIYTKKQERKILQVRGMYNKWHNATALHPNFKSNIFFSIFICDAIHGKVKDTKKKTTRPVSVIK